MAAAATAGVLAAGLVVFALIDRDSSASESDRDLIAFIGGDDPGRPIWLLDPVSGEARTSGDFGDRSVYGLSWSADRTGLALWRDASEPNCPVPGASCPAPTPNEEVLVLDVATGLIEVRAEGVASNQGRIAWHDGNVRIETAAASASPGPGAELFYLDGLRCAEISFRDAQAACLWSNPDEPSEAEIRVGAPNVFPGDASQAGRVLADGNPVWPRLSFDGRWVAWNRSDVGYHLRIARVPAAGAATAGLLKFGRCLGPTWSPAAPRLLCLSNDTPEESQISIVVVDAAQETWTAIGTWSRVREAAWSPDGQQIAFVAEIDNETGEIYVVNADGSELRRLTSNDTWEGELAWAAE